VKPKKRTLPSPKRGAIPTPPDELARAPKYVPPEEGGEPAESGDASKPANDSTTSERRTGNGKKEQT
jgi:hypothetical protein